MTLKLKSGIYRCQETPFRVGKNKVYRLFDLNGKDCGFRRKLTNKEIRNLGVSKNQAWIEVQEWELS
jgi:hypothetical protein